MNTITLVGIGAMAAAILGMIRVYHESKIHSADARAQSLRERTAAARRRTLYAATAKSCAHGCGRSSGSDDYCDLCYADQCLIGPDGTCRYTQLEEEE